MVARHRSSRSKISMRAFVYVPYSSLPGICTSCANLIRVCLLHQIRLSTCRPSFSCSSSLSPNSLIHTKGRLCLSMRVQLSALILHQTILVSATNPATLTSANNKVESRYPDVVSMNRIADGRLKR